MERTGNARLIEAGWARLAGGRERLVQPAGVDRARRGAGLMKGFASIVGLLALIGGTLLTIGMAAPGFGVEPGACGRMHYQHPSGNGNFGFDLDPWNLVMKEPDLGLGWSMDPGLTTCQEQGARSHMVWTQTSRGDAMWRTAVTTEVALLDNKEAALRTLEMLRMEADKRTTTLLPTETSTIWFSPEDTAHASMVVGNALLSAAVQGKSEKMNISSAEHAVKYMAGKLGEWPYLQQTR